MNDDTLNEIAAELNQEQTLSSQKLDAALANSNQFMDYENAWESVQTWNGRSYEGWELAFRRLGQFLLKVFSYFRLTGIRDDSIAAGNTRKTMAARLLELACQPKTKGQIAAFLRDKITGPTWVDTQCWQGLLEIKTELSQKTGLPPIPAKSKNDLGNMLKKWNNKSPRTIRALEWIESEDSGTKGFRHSNNDEHKDALMFLAGHLQ